MDTAPAAPDALPRGFWWKALPAFGGAFLVAALLPRSGRAGAIPPAGTLLLCASLIGLLTAIAIYLVLRLDLRLPAGVAVYGVVFNLLVVAVKFGLAPHGMYEVNRRVAFEDFAPDSPVMACAAAAAVFALYALVLVVLYRIARRRLLRELGVERSRVRIRRSAVYVLGGIILLTIASGGIVITLPLVVVGIAGQYVGFVFTSGVALVVALALGLATALAALAFRDVRQRAALVGDAAVLVSFFWVALAFLALYHVLWVVYVLALTATWPLRVVVPK